MGYAAGVRADACTPRKKKKNHEEGRSLQNGRCGQGDEVEEAIGSCDGLEILAGCKKKAFAAAAVVNR